jgi:hypothetical protein
MQIMLEPSTRPLRVLDSVILATEQFDRLRTIEEYDLWFVAERIAQKKSVASDLVNVAITEFRKYIALLALGYENLGMHSPEIDEVWHSFILFTREYSEFCQRTCGQMIHHAPNTSRRPRLSPTSVPTFKEAYEKFFGPLPSIWRSQGKRLTGGENPAASGERLFANTNLVGEECDTQGNWPTGDDGGDEILAGDCEVVHRDAVLAGDCDVVEDPPPDEDMLLSDCDSQGEGQCKALPLSDSPEAPSVSV